MSGLLPEQREIAQTLFDLPASEGYALAGGAALVVHGRVDRETRDLDAFLRADPGPNPGDVGRLADDLTNALLEGGWTVTTIRRHPTFVRMVASLDGAETEVDLAVDPPPLFPLQQVDGLPVLSPPDLAARKVLAIVDRAEGRDFTDLFALALEFGRSDCLSWAHLLDPGLQEDEIVESFGNLDRLGDTELPTLQPATIRAWFSEWATEIREGSD